MTWVENQKALGTQRILDKLEKGKNQSKYTQKCLQMCKSWGGTATTVEELNLILEERRDMADTILRTEISYYHDTHRADVIHQPELYRVNNISLDDKLINLCALLSDNDPIALPSNKDVLKVIPSCKGNQSTEETEEDEDEISVGKMYVTLINEDDINTWYLATCISVSDHTYEREFLHRVNKRSNLAWKHPSKPDTASLLAESIVQCEIEGEWDVSKQRNMKFTLRNHIHIDNVVNGYALQ